MPEETVMGNCAFCGQELVYGEPCVTVDVNVERFDHPEMTPTGEELMRTDVLDSEQALLLCRQCGGQVDDNWLRDAVEYYRSGGGNPWDFPAGSGKS